MSVCKPLVIKLVIALAFSLVIRDYSPAASQGFPILLKMALRPYHKFQSFKFQNLHLNLFPLQETATLIIKSTFQSPN